MFQLVSNKSLQNFNGNSYRRFGSWMLQLSIGVHRLAMDSATQELFSFKIYFKIHGRFGQLPVCQRSYEGICDELDNGLRSKHDSHLYILSDQFLRFENIIQQHQCDQNGLILALVQNFKSLANFTGFIQYVAKF